MIEVTLEESYSTDNDFEKLKRQLVEYCIHELYVGQAFGFKQKTLSVGPDGKTLNVSSFIVLSLVCFTALSAVMFASLWLFCQELLIYSHLPGYGFSNFSVDATAGR